MPGRGPQTFKKRQKEQQRKEKQQEKMARRLARKDDTTPRTDVDENGIERGYLVSSGIGCNLTFRGEARTFGPLSVY